MPRSATACRATTLTIAFNFWIAPEELNQPTKESVNLEILARQSFLKDNYKTVAILNYYNRN